MSPAPAAATPAAMAAHHVPPRSGPSRATAAAAAAAAKSAAAATKRTPAAAARSAYVRADGLARRRWRRMLRWLGIRRRPRAVVSRSAFAPWSWLTGAAGTTVRRVLALNDRDVEDLKKLFPPVASLISILLVLVGPIFMPAVYTAVCCAFFSLILFVNYSHIFRYVAVLFRLRKVVTEWAANPRSKVPFHHVHAVILPQYQEPLPLLRNTLRQLARHRAAREHYIIVLAMEAAEGPDAETKAAALRAEFGDRFHTVMATMHPANLPGECRGKGPNVAWAADQVDRHVRAAGIDASRVILTIADADAGIPELYFCELEREMAENPAHGARPLVDTQYRVFCPPIFFARNTTAVPAVVRTTDAAWSIAFMQNLGSARGLHFPCSSYSVTLPLARHVGGWDTTADAIGEDMHMFLKCFYHTRGLARATPIHVPINLANVQAATYSGTLASRFTQARRHFAGSADSLYALRHTFWPEAQGPLSPALPTRANPQGHCVVVPAAGDADEDDEDLDELDFAAADDAETGSVSSVVYDYGSYQFDRVLLLLHVFEAHLVPATTWLALLGLPIVPLTNPTLAATPAFATYLTTLSIFMLLPYLSMVLLYEYAHRLLARTGMLGDDLAAARATRHWSHVFDWLLLPISAIAYVAAPATSHCANVFRILVLRRGAKEFTYVVAEKGLVSSSDDDTIALESVAVAPTVPPVPVAGAASSRPAGLARPSAPLSDADSAVGDDDSGFSSISAASTPGAALSPSPAPPGAVPLLPPALSGIDALSPLIRDSRRGHSKQASTDSGFAELDAARDRSAAAARWVARVASLLESSSPRDPESSPSPQQQRHPAAAGIPASAAPVTV
ncbi:hypothetical protein H9P43_001030 [Blastocladiella emersonii ATCC 22665]|nr:hypothetical protein H9P43_001030 [Blastocladiella emersonii ATCC 22665]